MWGKAERMEASWEPSRIPVVSGEDHTLANNAHLLTVQPPVAMATITAQLSNHGNYIYYHCNDFSDQVFLIPATPVQEHCTPRESMVFFLL